MRGRSGRQCWRILPPVPGDPASLIASIHPGTTVYPVAVFVGNRGAQPAALGPAASIDTGAAVQQVPPFGGAPPVPGVAYGGWHAAKPTPGPVNG
jgi:hypothetical protein